MGTKWKQNISYDISKVELYYSTKFHLYLTTENLETVQYINEASIKIATIKSAGQRCQEYVKKKCKKIYFIIFLN